MAASNWALGMLLVACIGVIHGQTLDVPAEQYGRLGMRVHLRSAVTVTGTSYTYKWYREPGFEVIYVRSPDPGREDGAVNPYLPDAWKFSVDTLGGDNFTLRINGSEASDFNRYYHVELEAVIKTTKLLMANGQTVNLQCEEYFGDVAQHVILNCSGTTMGTYTLTWYKRLLDGVEDLVYIRYPTGAGFPGINYRDRFDILPGSDCSLRINSSIHDDYGFVYRVLSGNADYNDVLLSQRKTGEIGKHIHRLYDASLGELNEAELCRRWARNQNATLVEGMIHAVQQNSDGCPCTLVQALTDNRFVELNKSTEELRWFYTFEEGFYMDTYGTMQCCYITLGELTYGHVVLQNPLYSPTQHDRDDVQPRDWCCKMSRQCHIYSTYRPAVSCEDYLPVKTGQTLDVPAVQYGRLGKLVYLRSTVTVTGTSYTYKWYRESGFEVIYVRSPDPGREDGAVNPYLPDAWKFSVDTLGGKNFTLRINGSEASDFHRYYHVELEAVIKTTKLLMANENGTYHFDVTCDPSACEDIQMKTRVLASVNTFGYIPAPVIVWKNGTGGDDFIPGIGVIITESPSGVTDAWSQLEITSASGLLNVDLIITFEMWLADHSVNDPAGGYPSITVKTGPEWE